MGINSTDIEAVLATHPEFHRESLSLNVPQPSSPDRGISAPADSNPIPLPQVRAFPHASASLSAGVSGPDLHAHARDRAAPVSETAGDTVTAYFARSSIKEVHACPSGPVSPAANSINTAGE